VRRALDRLRARQKLTDTDYERLLRVLKERDGPEEAS
jgi:hypothetical protein